MILSGEQLISPLEVEMVDLFVNLAGVFGMPRSVGEIYGLLFVATAPLSMDAIGAKLQISAGSASQGLRLLRSFRAVKSQYVAGERREHFVAETELRTVLSGLLKEQVYPHLESGTERLQRMHEIVKTMPIADRHIAEGKIQKLERWNEVVQGVLPLVQGLAGT